MIEDRHETRQVHHKIAGGVIRRAGARAGARASGRNRGNRDGRPYFPYFPFLAEAWYDPVYGARSLKRLLQKEVHDELSTRILDNELGGGEAPEAPEAVAVDYKDGRLIFEKSS